MSRVDMEQLSRHRRAYLRKRAEMEAVRARTALRRLGRLQVNARYEAKLRLFRAESEIARLSRE